MPIFIFHFLSFFDFQTKNDVSSGKDKSKKGFVELGVNVCEPFDAQPAEERIECEPDFNFLEFFSHFRAMLRSFNSLKDTQQPTQFAGRFGKRHSQKIESAIAEVMAMGWVGIGSGRGKVRRDAFQASVGAEIRQISSIDAGISVKCSMTWLNIM